MTDPTANTIQPQDEHERARHESEQPAASAEQQDWQTPQLEDVSEQVMAQPYIRFT